MANFFISYTQADRPWAEWIAWTLEEAGFTATIQAWDFRPGGNFVLDMQKAIAEADRTIAILSPDYLSSGFGAAEWAAAFAQDPTGNDGKLLPVRIRPVDLKGLLPQIVYIDVFGHDESGAKSRGSDRIIQTRRSFGEISKCSIPWRAALRWRRTLVWSRHPRLLKRERVGGRAPRRGGRM